MLKIQYNIVQECLCATKGKQLACSYYIQTNTEEVGDACRYGAISPHAQQVTQYKKTVKLQHVSMQ